MPATRSAMRAHAASYGTGARVTVHWMSGPGVGAAVSNVGDIDWDGFAIAPKMASPPAFDQTGPGQHLAMAKAALQAGLFARPWFATGARRMRSWRNW